MVARARAAGLPLRSDDVVNTFSCLNDRVGVATLCFRLRSDPKDAVHLGNAFNAFKHCYPAALAGTARAVEVHCHVSGVVDDEGKLFDWWGQPSDAMG